MMDTDLTLTNILERAADLFSNRQIITQTAKNEVHRYTYSEMYQRCQKLAQFFDEYGLADDARVASFSMNNYRHLELYFAPACSGRSLHMVNVKLPDEHIIHLLNHAKDTILFLDPQFTGKLETLKSEFESIELFVVLDDSTPDTDLEPVVSYEKILSDSTANYDWPDLDQTRECGICYTSGTTGSPKGVTYSHRALFLHSLMLGHTDTLGISQNDSIMPIVPMFHANGWGIPYASLLSGSKLVLPDKYTQPEILTEIIGREDVNKSAAVPTVWIEVLEYLKNSSKSDISSVDELVVGGSAPPESLIREYESKYGIKIIQAWGMTETSPLATVSRLSPEMSELGMEEQFKTRAKQGVPVPGIELRICDEAGDIVPRDGESIGEIEVKGAWVTDAYYGSSGSDNSFTDDGWLRTGDIATWDTYGFVQIVDRAKDMIKSGGEWISSVELENELMAHPEVVESTVIGIPDEKWQERPLAYVVTNDENLTSEDLKDYLEERFPDWWIPDQYKFVREIPRTSTGKFDKKQLRDKHASDAT